MDKILLLRLHRLYKMTGRLPVEGKYCRVIQYFEGLFDGLVIEPFLDKHPTDLFYHKKGTIYMRQNSERGELRCKYYDYWTFFYEIGIAHGDIETVIQCMVSEHTKREVETPRLNL